MQDSRERFKNASKTKSKTFAGLGLSNAQNDLKSTEADVGRISNEREILDRWLEMLASAEDGTQSNP